MKITKVEVQTKDKTRVNVYADDVFFAGIDMDTCVKNGIKAGKEFNEEELSRVIFESECQRAMGKAAKYMTKALKTTKQIKDYLKTKGYDGNVIDYCIAKLGEYNYLDDEVYVKAYIKDKGSTCGVHKLRAGLTKKGISSKLLDEIFESYESNLDDIRKLALKKLANKPKTYENLSKTFAFLSNLGFEYDDIKRVINELRENDDESWD